MTSTPLIDSRSDDAASPRDAKYMVRHEDVQRLLARYPATPDRPLGTHVERVTVSLSDIIEHFSDVGPLAVPISIVVRRATDGVLVLDITVARYAV